MRWVVYVARKEKQKHVQGFDGNLKEDGHFKDLFACERMILKYMLKKQDER